MTAEAAPATSEGPAVGAALRAGDEAAFTALAEGSLIKAIELPPTV
jgi:hypothetical protein